MGALRMSGLATDQAEIDYPESDGQPMAETDLHRDEMFELIGLLRQRYAATGDVYVSGNLFVYYEEGNPRAVVAPDVFVVFGVPGHRRRIYKLWAEGAPPAVVIEVTSRKTRREDLRTKMTLYARLGVAEYFLYDPESDYLRPALRGHRLAGDTYVALAPDATGALRSARLGLDLRLVSGRLELFDTVSGERQVRTSEQAEALARAEAENAELRREVERLCRERRG
jgi:Uma2 family endonuclease